jgi:hypothetical protein
MNQEHFWIEDGAEVAPPAWQQLRNKYGSVEGLEDDELASPAELERAYCQELWGAILLIPCRKSYSPAWDVSASADYNAFASVDFDRMRPEFDKARYVREKLWEQVKDLVIMMKIVSERIKDIRKYKVLRLVGKGVLDANDIQHWDLWQLAIMYRRALSIRKEIDRLAEYSRKKKQQDHEKWLES